MVAAIVVSGMVLIVFVGIIYVMSDAGLFEGFNIKKLYQLRKRIRQLEQEKKQLEIELTAYRLNLPWVPEKERNGTQE